MNKRLLKTATILLALILLASGLSACSLSPQTIRMDVNVTVTNLDPQFATDTLGCTILANTMEGLLRKNAYGGLEPAAAASYKVENSGRRYTFTLREGLVWSNGTPLTANDFVFAFRRIFSSQVPSPYAEEYLAIEGAQQALTGEIPVERIGVSAPDAHTVVFTLSQPTGSFAERLANTAALPCNKDFFEATRARYGLGTQYLIFNGPMKLDSWHNDRSLVLRPNEQYREPVAGNGVAIYTTRTANGKSTAMQLFTEGKSDLFMATAQEMEQLAGIAESSLELENRVWQLVQNTRSAALQSEPLRRALVMALDRGEFASRSPSIYHPAASLIPESARLAGLVEPSLLPHNLQWALDKASEGWQQLEEVGIAQKPLTLLVSEESELSALGGYMQRQWKDILSVYVNMEMLPEAELQKRLEKGDFTLAIYRTEATMQSPEGILGEYIEGGVRNYSGWSSPEFTALLEEAVRVDSTAQAARLYEQAEQMIIDSAAALPLLTQSSYYAFGKGVGGVEVISGYLCFKNAVRLG